MSAGVKIDPPVSGRIVAKLEMWPFLPPLQTHSARTPFFVSLMSNV